MTRKGETAVNPTGQRSGTDNAFCNMPYLGVIGTLCVCVDILRWGNTEHIASENENAIYSISFGRQFSLKSEVFMLPGCRRTVGHCVLLVLDLHGNPIRHEL